MQNIPGLSFFDGLTRSRSSQSTSHGTRSSENTTGSPLETPLRDAASLRSNDIISQHPSSEQGEQPDSFEDPLSPSGQFYSSSSSTSLPTTSFSRRAATVSSGSPSPIPGLPRRTSGASTTSRSSILSKEGIFSVPALISRSSNMTNSTDSQAGRERSPSIQTKETMEPTAKDVALMAMGTQAYAMLKRIQEHPIELADIIRLLVTKKAILILPTSAASTDEPVPERAHFEDHVIIPESNYGESLFVTLSGIRGVLKPASSSITILGLATGQDFGTFTSDATGSIKRSFFDNITKGEGSSEGSASNSSPVNELKLVNSSKKPVVIFVESVGSIHALLVDSMIPKQEGEEAPTPIVPLAQGLATVKDRSAARRTASSGSSVRSVTIMEDRDATPLPKLPKIASDLPLEWDSMIRDLERQETRKYDDVRRRFWDYGTASGLSHRWSDQDFDEVQQWVEAWLCRELYSIIFPHSPHGINRQDYLQDEQLQAKIAALNFLDLTLEHLGFVLEHPEDVAHIAQVVREGGVEMQKLAQVRSPTDKMNVILSSHRVVVDALNREPAVQEMLAEADQSSKAAATTATPSDGDVAKTNSKRNSMLKILMDGDIPRADTHASVSGSPSPKIRMDEGFERPSMALSEAGQQKRLSPDMAEYPSSRTNAERKEGPAESAEEMEGEDAIVNEVKNDALAKDTEDYTSETQIDDLDKTKAKTNEVNPADIDLPESPVTDTATMPLIVVPAEAVVATSEERAEASQQPSSPSSRKQYSADVLLPLLIFSVVKSNPPMLISNLRYIQRFKVQDHLTGELAYCLTNMMAVVSFLETLDPQALGLSSNIRVMSDVSDIQVIPGRSNPAPLLNFQEGIDHTKALGHKVSQEIVGVAEGGIKVISDVVQDGYSKFFGRFLTTADGTRSFGNTSNNRGGVLSKGSRPLSAASSLAATAAAAAAAEEERKQRVAEEKKRGMELVSAAGVTSDVAMLSADSRTESADVEKSSPYESAMEHAARNRVLEVVRSSQGPQFQFMACTDSDDLRLSDVKSLLEDYQRIGKILEEMKRLS
ncbi:hypothetical protein BGX28_004056 [Mortierella sp. GBA30]|nr:hypothetical protein BGX28_004056 [Mortierella sp. GBA30]